MLIFLLSSSEYSINIDYQKQVTYNGIEDFTVIERRKHDMSIIIKKFGGTSLESIQRMRRVADIIQSCLDRGDQLVVVVSAMGRKGAPYATDTLIGLCKDISGSDISIREMDMLMSCGEIISGVLLVHVLRDCGISAVLLNGAQAGIVTDDKFSNASVLEVDPKRIQSELEHGRVVIITGFQGITRDGEITTLGRGGSDTSAVVIGSALNAGVVEIYTDVEGIMTADPKIQPNARTIESINYDEVFQMAETGAKVIHPRAVEVAKNSNIVLKIKNTLSEGEGTSVGYNRGKDTYNMSKKLITAVASKDNVAQVIVNTSDIAIFSEILDEIKAQNISIDMINFFMVQKAFTVNSDEVSKIEETLKKHSAEYTIATECSKVTVIGDRITGIPGVMSRIVTALSGAGVDILQTTDSHMTISCLIKTEDVKKAVNSLHDEFALYM